MENMVTSADFWKGKKVLVTGHTGFKGGWLCVWLQMLKAKVSGYSLPPPTQPSLYQVARVGSGMDSVIGDIRDLDRLKSVIKDHETEIIIHLAAQSLVRRSYLDPVETFSINVLGTVNVLEAARLSDAVRVVLVVTSDKCYENKRWIWPYRETEPLGGSDPYSSSKGCAELVSASYRDSFFSGSDSRVAVATARAGNVIGGGDWAEDRLVPDIMRAFLANQPVLIRNPEAVRPWQHVLEPLNGYLMLAERLWSDGSAYADAWNFGPNTSDTKAVRWVVDEMACLWGEGASWHEDHRTHPSEAQLLSLDSSKARHFLGWSTKLALEGALRQTVAWYKVCEEKKNMRDVTEAEIRDYVKGPCS
jgi:CDP-glucose 4,6-dehydratase